MQDQEQTTGNVVWFNEEKGYGFIKPDNSDSDAFVHIRDVEEAGMQTLKEGQKISFELQYDPKKDKYRAANLQDAS